MKPKHKIVNIIDLIEFEFIRNWDILEEQDFQNQIQGQVAQTQQGSNAQQKSQGKVGSDPSQSYKLNAILKQSYPQFVALLQGHIKDPKFLAFLQAGLEDGKIKSDDVVQFNESSVPCSQLRPTQNEIDFSKSLYYPLTQETKEKLTAYARGGSFNIANSLVVTCGGGKYIIDGHHRWSQLYCINPEAQIGILDMTAFKDPSYALKIAQLGIAKTIGKIPTEDVKGLNLLTCGVSQIANAIKATGLSEGARAFFESMRAIDKRVNYKNALSYASYYIWNNVKRMQQNNKPVAPSASRSIMPQTSNKETGLTTAQWRQSLEGGTTNINEPARAHANRKTSNQQNKAWKGQQTQGQGQQAQGQRQQAQGQGQQAQGQRQQAQGQGQQAQGQRQQAQGQQAQQPKRRV